MRVGALELGLVSDGALHVDGGGVFGAVPRALWGRKAPPDEENRVELALNCLLIRSASALILVDTGMGEGAPASAAKFFGWERGPGLMEGLSRLGVGASDVDVVINTHLHFDHCGGNTRREGDGWAAAFPRAEYWIQRGEWEEASRPNELTKGSYFAHSFQPLGSRARLVDGDAQVTPEVRCAVTRGHTRWHQSVVVESQGQAALFTGDLALLPVQMERLNWLSAYDLEPLETLESKRRMVRWALEHRATVLLEHEVATPVGTLAEERGWIRFEPA